MSIELSAESKKVIESQQVKEKFDELTNLSRMIVNTLNLLCSSDIQVPTMYAKPVAEIQNWLEAMHKAVQTQIDVLKPMLAPEVTETVKPVIPAILGESTPAADAPKA